MLNFNQFLRVQEAVATAGIYASRSLDDPSADALSSWMDQEEIPNPVPKDKLHCTVVATTSDLPQYKPDLKPLQLTSDSFSIGKLGDALVLKFHSSELTRQNLKARHLGAELTFPSYIPHITLSYKFPQSFDISSLKPPPFFLTLEPEVMAPFESDWLKDLKLAESAPPSKKLEKWLQNPEIRKKFKAEYGAGYEKVMYAKAWAMYQDS